MPTPAKAIHPQASMITDTIQVKHSTYTARIQLQLPESSPLGAAAARAVAQLRLRLGP
jgi:hypothetical protein